MTSTTRMMDVFLRDPAPASCPVIDMHAHMGWFGSMYLDVHDAGSMVRAMDRAGVERAFFAHHEPLFSVDAGHRSAMEAVAEHPDRLRAYFVYNPNYPSEMEAQMAACMHRRDVFAGFKLHPDIHATPLSDDRYRPALEVADAEHLPVLSHTWGGSGNNGVGAVRYVAEKYPGLTLIAGHSLNNRWEEAIGLARDYPHVVLELTSVLGLHGVLERLVEGAGSDRIVFGVDWPWFDYHHGIGALLSADITDDDRLNIMHRNARRIPGVGCTRNE